MHCLSGKYPDRVPMQTQPKILMTDASVGTANGPAVLPGALGSLAALSTRQQPLPAVGWHMRLCALLIRQASSCNHSYPRLQFDILSLRIAHDCFCMEAMLTRDSHACASRKISRAQRSEVCMDACLIGEADHHSPAAGGAPDGRRMLVIQAQGATAGKASCVPLPSQCPPRQGYEAETAVPCRRCLARTAPQAASQQAGWSFGHLASATA